jgi:dCMP deaminase
VEDRAELLLDDKIKNDMVIHAEQNALLFSGQMAKDAIIYVAGKSVCSRCAGSIIQAGIRRVVARDPEAMPDKEIQSGRIDWKESGRLAVQMFDQAEVSFCPSDDYDNGIIPGDKFSSDSKTNGDT